ncbi:MAG: hypothetical protein KKA19_06300 [Candidatus Margulisbacteria bacterium]|nr:hypothetical protein [Candidatus Margulisiibacteriota bacterium]
MKTIKIKKIYKGYCSIRSYIIDDLIKAKEGVIIEYAGKKMTLTPEQVKKHLQLQNRIFYSAYDGKSYKLYDYFWIADK